MAPAVPFIGKAVAGTLVGGLAGEGVKAVSGAPSIFGGPDPVLPPPPKPEFGSGQAIAGLNTKSVGGVADVLARHFANV